jgi:hypothetical protein
MHLIIKFLIVLSFAISARASDTLVESLYPGSYKTGEIIEARLLTKNEKIVARLERMSPGQTWIVPDLGILILSDKPKENENNSDYTEAKLSFTPLYAIPSNGTKTIANIGEIKFKDIEVIDDGEKSEKIVAIKTNDQEVSMVLWLIIAVAMIFIGSYAAKKIKVIRKKNLRLAKLKDIRTKVSSAKDRHAVEECFNEFINNQSDYKVIESDYNELKELLHQIMYKRSWAESELELAYAKVLKVLNGMEPIN